MGQLGLSFVLPIFLQDAKHLTAATNGLWMLPSGLFVIVGSQVGGLLTRRFGTVNVVRTGLVFYSARNPSHLSSDRVAYHGLDTPTRTRLLRRRHRIRHCPADQRRPVGSSDDERGVASGANSTGRQVGSALGVSVIGSLLTVRTVSAATSRIRASSVAASVKVQAIAGIHGAGSGYSPPSSVSAGDARAVGDAIAHGVISGTRLALLFAMIVILIGAVVSFLIPNESAVRRAGRGRRSRVRRAGAEGCRPLTVSSG